MTRTRSPSLHAVAALAALVLAACTTAPTDVTPTPGTAQFPPTANVQILDQPPTRPYIEIATLDQVGDPGALRAQVLAQLHARARQLGADAVIVKDVSFREAATQRLNPTTGFYESVGGQVVPAFKGVAIRYR